VLDNPSCRRAFVPPPPTRICGERAERQRQRWLLAFAVPRLPFGIAHQTFSEKE